MNLHFLQAELTYGLTELCLIPNPGKNVLYRVAESLMMEHIQS